MTGRSALEERTVTLHLPVNEWVAVDVYLETHKETAKSLYTSILTDVAATLHKHQNVHLDFFKRALGWHDEPASDEHSRQVRVALQPMHWILFQVCADALESPLDRAVSNFFRARLRIQSDQRRLTRREIAERVVKIQEMPQMGEEYDRAVAELERDSGMDYDFIVDQDWEAHQRQKQEERDFGAFYDLLMGPFIGDAE